MKNYTVEIETVSKVYSWMTYDLQAESEDDLRRKIDSLHKDGRFVACDNVCLACDDYEDEILSEKITSIEECK